MNLRGREPRIAEGKALGGVRPVGDRPARRSLLVFSGHGGARQVDHVIPATERPDLVWDQRNCRPAHGSPGNPCPLCSAACGRRIYCNQLRSGYSIDRALRLIAEMAAAHQAKAPGRPARPPDAGRPW
jgi:hypothetical protein